MTVSITVIIGLILNAIIFPMALWWFQRNAEKKDEESEKKEKAKEELLLQRFSELRDVIKDVASGVNKLDEKIEKFERDNVQAHSKIWDAHNLLRDRVSKIEGAHTARYPMNSIQNNQGE